MYAKLLLDWNPFETPVIYLSARYVCRRIFFALSPPTIQVLSLSHIFVAFTFSFTPHSPSLLISRYPSSPPIPHVLLFKWSLLPFPLLRCLALSPFPYVFIFPTIVFTSSFLYGYVFYLVLSLTSHCQVFLFFLPQHHTVLTFCLFHPFTSPLLSFPSSSALLLHSLIFSHPLSPSYDFSHILLSPSSSLFLLSHFSVTLFSSCPFAINFLSLFT